MDALAAVVRAREILSQATPLRTDCGRICGGACCRTDGDGQGGMLLFPGEEALYDRLPAGFSILPERTVSPDGRLLMCSGVCDRSLRPLACRFFPLRPTARGRVVMDRRGFFVCPLTESGMGGLSGDFVAAAREAAAVLCENETQRAFLEALGASIRRVLSQSSL
ncbi:MAG: hypothetical protein MR021_00490 [Clostridiales bacterium]|nr:hypothetical protein [Clostridiales bacterium]